MKLADLATCMMSRGAWKTMKVVDWEGNLRRFSLLTTAAELMLEAPGHTIVSGEQARITRRAIAMKADERLRPGEVYLLCPVQKTGSKLPEKHIAAANGARRRRKFLAAGDCSPAEEVKGSGGAGQRWKPLLETAPESENGFRRKIVPIWKKVRTQ